MNSEADIRFDSCCLKRIQRLTICALLQQQIRLVRQIFQGYGFFFSQRMPNREHSKKLPGFDNMRFQALDSFRIGKPKVDCAGTDPLANAGIVPLMKYQLHVRMFGPELLDNSGQPVAGHAGHCSNTNHACFNPFDFIRQAAHGAILQYGILDGRKQVLTLRR